MNGLTTGTLVLLVVFLWHCPGYPTVTQGKLRIKAVQNETIHESEDVANQTMKQTDSQLPTTGTQTPQPQKVTRMNIFDECVLMKSNSTYAQLVMESYLELGYYDIMHEVDIAFDVLPDRYSHNGPLFSIGTENFQYYEWKTKAFKTQYFVVEFVYSAMSMLLKALMEPHMKPMEICRTYPEPYDIGDGQWHHVRAQRLNHGTENDVWYLTLDDMTINTTVSIRNDVQLKDRPAYLGGRPGFRSYQFKGVIKNFKIRGERVPLRGRATYGLVEVWHCSAPEVAKFIQSIQESGVKERKQLIDRNSEDLFKKDQKQSEN